MREIRLSGSVYLVLNGRKDDKLECRFSNRYAAVSFLRRYAFDCEAMTKLRRVVGQGSGAINVSRFNDSEILDQLSWRLVSGQIKIFKTVQVRAPSGGAARKADLDEPFEDDDDWISVEEKKAGGGEDQVTETTYSVFLRLPVDAGEAENVDDKFTLIGGSSINQKKYEQTQTTSGEIVAGDDCVDLLFTDLLPDLNYWLKVVPGEDSDEYFVFEKMTWAKLKPIARPK
jgi:hypothetical protein